MAVTAHVRQKRGEIPERWCLFVDGRKSRIAEMSLRYSYLHEINTGTVEGNRIFSVRRRFSIVRPHYTFSFTSGAVYELRTERFMPRVYACQGPIGLLSIYAHRSSHRRFSVFLGSVQVAAFVQNLLTLGLADRYELVAENAEHLDILFAVILALDHHQDPWPGSQLYRFNTALLQLQAREFDEVWYSTRRSQRGA